METYAAVAMPQVVLVSVSMQGLRPQASGIAARGLAKPPVSSPRYARLGQLALVSELGYQPYLSWLQQRTRQYVGVTQPSLYSSRRRTRICTFLASAGVDNLRVNWAVEVLPTLLHFSLPLFLPAPSHLSTQYRLHCLAHRGLVNSERFFFIPLFRHDGPYHAPALTSFQACKTCLKNQ